MGRHHHGDPAWPVRVDDEDGTPWGTGVLLDDQHVLTCAHVVRRAGAAPGGSAVRVRVTSLACRPRWSRSARVAPGSWVHEGGTPRRDVALLRLDEPAECGITTVLRRAPLSGAAVRVHGLSAQELRLVPLDAELGCGDERDAEWGLLTPLAPDAPWLGRLCSGAGVVARDGAFAGRVIGIVAADQAADGAAAARILPTEAIEHVLRPQIARFVDGERANLMGAPDAARHGEVALAGPLRLALTRELTRLFDRPWSGTAVVVTAGAAGAAGAGDTWLARLVGTADPATRAGAPDGAFRSAPQGTVWALGAVDAAYDARNKSVADVRAYLVGRFGLSGGSDRDVYLQLLRREPPARLVVDGIDRAEDPDELIRRLLGPLAQRARARGLKLVLGFADRPPAGLSREVFLDPAPLAGSAARPVSAAEAEEAVQRLAAHEDAAIPTQTTWGATFHQAPELPPSIAPRLRVRLAVARDTGADAELAAIHAAAGAAEAGVARFEQTMRQLADLHANLTAGLELYRREAARHLPEEDLQLGAQYTRAARELRTAPIHLGRAKLLVNRYIDEVNRRIGAAGTRHVDGAGRVDATRGGADTVHAHAGDADAPLDARTRPADTAHGPGDAANSQLDAAHRRGDAAHGRGGAASGPGDSEDGRIDQADRRDDGG